MESGFLILRHVNPPSGWIPVSKICLPGPPLCPSPPLLPGFWPLPHSIHAKLAHVELLGSLDTSLLFAPPCFCTCCSSLPGIPSHASFTLLKFSLSSRIHLAVPPPWSQECSSWQGPTYLSRERFVDKIDNHIRALPWGLWKAKPWDDGPGTWGTETVRPGCQEGGAGQRASWWGLWRWRSFHSQSW